MNGIMSIMGLNSQNVVRPMIRLQDGTTVSIQASEGHYSAPRDSQGPWTHVEVGFPSVRPEPWSEWEQYAENPQDPTETVYGYVPIELVAEFVSQHHFGKSLQEHFSQNEVI